MISHIVGCFIGVGMLVAAVFCARSDMGLAGGVIYGASLMLLYWASSVYHGLPFAAVGDKKIFRLLDHCSIFVLVAGTCTPCLLGLIARCGAGSGWLFYALVWGMAIGGIALLCVNMKRFRSIAVLMYVLMGIFLFVRAGDLSALIGPTGMCLLLAGGGVYLLGLLFYGLGSRREWMHSVFHLFCLVGSVLHCVCICGYVI